MACPHLHDCPLLGLFPDRGAASLWTANYCESDHTRCQRVRLSAAGRKVPHNLLPNGRVKGVELPRQSA